MPNLSCASVEEMEDEDDVKLSPYAMEALASFYSDRDARDKQFEDLKTQAEEDYDGQRTWTMETFAEDWNASQFWVRILDLCPRTASRSDLVMQYSDETATALAKELLEGASHETHIAVVSAPSVFIQLKNLTADMPTAERPSLTLLEFDERFAVFKNEFVFYDFASPLKLPGDFKGRFDRLVVDPPFLNADCQTKAAMTVRWMSKQRSSSPSPEKLIICTGERMQSLILKLYGQAQVSTTTFRPVHTKGLSNEFYCYANFASTLWSFQDMA